MIPEKADGGKNPRSLVKGGHPYRILESGMSFRRLHVLICTYVTAIQAGLLYTALMILLALVSFGFLVYEWWPGARESIVLLGDEVDLYVALIFFVDFWLGHFFNIQFATRRLYWRENWLNLISSIPITSEVTQAFRLLRILRGVRVIKVFLNVWTAKQQLSQRQKFLERPGSF